MSILNEEHQLQQQLFDEMHSRGWYPTECAEEQKLQKAKNQFCSGK
ncbi:MAG: spore coat protein, partial [Clostridia bacterium]|nr:spore coat protein [Clostridia bacterium]